MTKDTNTDQTMENVDGWDFEPEDIVREKHAKPSPVPGCDTSDKQEYLIKRRLVDPSDGGQFYHVEKPDGGSHLYSAGVLRQYETIDVSESQVWSEETVVERNGK